MFRVIIIETLLLILMTDNNLYSFLEAIIGTSHCLNIAKHAFVLVEMLIICV